MDFCFVLRVGSKADTQHETFVEPFVSPIFSSPIFRIYMPLIRPLHEGRFTLGRASNVVIR